MSAKIQTGTGTDRMAPFPSQANSGPNPNTAKPSVISSDSPRAPANPPSVTMIGEKSRRAINQPFSTPQAVPAPSQNSSASGRPRPASIDLPKIVAANTAIEPTDRST